MSTSVTEPLRAFRPEPIRNVRPRVDLTAAQIEDLGHRYRNGATVPDLVEVFGCHRATVLNTLKRLGIKGRAQRRALTNDQAVEAAKLFARGESLVSVGQHFGVDPSTVRRELRKLGISTSR